LKQGLLGLGRQAKGVLREPKLLLWILVLQEQLEKVVVVVAEALSFGQLILILALEV
jgi:hypothetical protein